MEGTVEAMEAMEDTVEDMEATEATTTARGWLFFSSKMD